MRHASALNLLTCLALGSSLAACSPTNRPPAPEAAKESTPLPALASELPSRELPKVEKEVEAPPLSLTASDGTGLKLVSLTARAVVQEPVAFTELRLTFDNPNARTIEGRFTIDLPPGAAISRFAMKIDDRWQEGEVVERQAARVAYEDFLHRKQDPALLENETGNRFSARVFPIPANGRKELIVSYSQELGDSAVPYRMMLRGLPELEQLDAQIIIDRPSDGKSGNATSVGGDAETRKVITVKKDHYKPDQDLEVSAAKAGPVGIRHETLAMARVEAVGNLPGDAPDDLTILFDTSASRALGFAQQLQRLGKLIESLRKHTKGELKLRVVTFDQGVSLIFEGDAKDFGPEQLRQIYARRALGASDLTGALERLARAGTLSPRVLVVSDGIATAGKSEVSAVKAAVLSMADAGVRRVDALIDGGLQDHDMLAALATAGLERNGVVVDARLSPEAIAEKLALATIANLHISVPGARWSWPTEVKGIQPGDEVLVYADLPIGQAMTVVMEGKDTIETTVATTAVSRPLLERAWVGAQLDAMTFELSEVGPDQIEHAKVLKERIVEISTKHRVLSDFTALLVLETEADYARFNIDRRALADIMTVGPAGIELVERAKESPLVATNQWRDPLPDEDERAPAPASDKDVDQFDDAKGGDGGANEPEAPEAKPVSEGEAWDGAESAAAPPAEEPAAKEEQGNAEPRKKSAIDFGGDGPADDLMDGLSGAGKRKNGLQRIGGGKRDSDPDDDSGYGRGSGGLGRAERVPLVRQDEPTIEGSLDAEIIRRIVRAHIAEVTHCYNVGLAKDAKLHGKVEVTFDIEATGIVGGANVRKHNLSDPEVAKCISKAVRRWTFPRPTDGETVRVDYPFALGGPSSAPMVAPAPLTAEEKESIRLEDEARRAAAQLAEDARVRAEEAQRAAEAARLAELAELRRTEGSPYTGRMFTVMSLIDKGQTAEALADAVKWSDESPGDVLALLAMGDALKAAGKPESASRAYGSIIDLFPARADLRRHAGTRLEGLGGGAMFLATDTYQRAVEQRPDHPSGHRMLAYALVRQGDHEAAFEAISAGLKQTYPTDRFAGAQRILAEDAGIIAAAWAAAEPTRRDEIVALASAVGTTLATEASTRFIMTWETDANDVDFHIYDGEDGHAFYSTRELESGGELYADVVTGYGPECFAIQGKPHGFPYRFEANYYSRGPMGYGMGALQILQHDGRGGLALDDRPFIIMKDAAFVKLGEMKEPLRTQPSLRP